MNSLQMLREHAMVYGTSGTSTHDLMTLLGLKDVPFAEVLTGNTAIGNLTPTMRSRAEALAELIRRAPMELAKAGKERLTSPSAAARYLIPKCLGWAEERFGILCLDSKGNALADRILTSGISTGTFITPREVAREALRFSAVTALVYHNHPSGDPTPSLEDTTLTRRLRSGMESIGIPLSDHIIVGNNSYHSFRSAEGRDRT